jgi:3-oxoacyl-[acyl-carrier-protein] synthase II
MTPKRRRVVVTGIGAITPIGLARDGLWQGLRREQSAVGPVTRFDASQFRSQVAAEVCGFVAGDHIEAKRAKRLDRFGQFSVVAARMALEDAELHLAREDRDRIGANMGSALGGVAFAEEQSRRFLAGGLRAVDPIVALAVYGGASSCNIAIEFGISGPNSTNAMSCASGTMAIGDAFRAIRDDYADAMLCGGSETPLAPLCYGAFALIRAMSTRNDDPSRASRPFDKDRDGFVMGEAAVVLVLEEYDRAVARGARMYAEVVGYGTTNDAYHMTAPLPSGVQAARSIRLALRDAELAPSEIGYVNAHGSSTPLNDPTETAALKQVLGDWAYRVPVSGTKGYYGHALGASGAIEAAICALSLTHEWLPPTINLQEADSSCDLDYIPSTGRDQRVEYVLSNSFGFGGINASLVFRRID